MVFISLFDKPLSIYLLCSIKNKIKISAAAVGYIDMESQTIASPICNLSIHFDIAAAAEAQQ